jgi:hypothetical protein
MLAAHLIRMGGDEDNWNVMSLIQQLSLQIETVQALHLKISDEASRIHYGP